MIVGFTGTRAGMSTAQMETVTKLLKDLKPESVVHGDCYGSDKEFHDICIKLQGSMTNPGPPRIVIYPSTSKTRAYCEGAELIYPPEAPLKRDMRIARGCDKLIATPKEFEEQIRSGTWTTVRYARFANKLVYIILPDGEIK